MKKQEQQSTNREWQVDKKLSTFLQTDNLNQTMRTNNPDNFTSDQFKLINKMSKMVKYTNNSVNDVIGTLNIKSGDTEDAVFKEDTSDLLIKTSTNIKNLNHSLIQQLNADTY